MVRGHANETTEATDAVIYMNDIVANLELLQFLQRQRHLATTGTVAAQVVLMEAVEDLVVGEHAHLQVVVGKACMEGLGDGGKGNIRVHKDFL